MATVRACARGRADDQDVDTIPTGCRAGVVSHALHLPSHAPLRCAARNFKLLDELEDAEKSAKGGADISLGLQRADDTMMRDWQASIFQAPGSCRCYCC
jgi:hypothetical protein